MNFISTIFAEHGSMIAAVSLSQYVIMCIAKNLQNIECLLNLALDKHINLELYWLICMSVISIGTTPSALKFTLFGEASGRILRILDHLTYDTMPACCLSAAM